MVIENELIITARFKDAGAKQGVKELTDAEKEAAAAAAVTANKQAHSNTIWGKATTAIEKVTVKKKQLIGTMSSMAPVIANIDGSLQGFTSSIGMVTANLGVMGMAIGAGIMVIGQFIDGQEKAHQETTRVTESIYSEVSALGALSNALSKIRSSKEIQEYVEGVASNSVYARLGAAQGLYKQAMVTNITGQIVNPAMALATSAGISSTAIEQTKMQADTIATEYIPVIADLQQIIDASTAKQKDLNYESAEYARLNDLINTSEKRKGDVIEEAQQKVFDAYATSNIAIGKQAKATGIGGGGAGTTAEDWFITKQKKEEDAARAYGYDFNFGVERGIPTGTKPHGDAADAALDKSLKSLSEKAAKRVKDNEAFKDLMTEMTNQIGDAVGQGLAEGFKPGNNAEEKRKALKDMAVSIMQIMASSFITVPGVGNLISGLLGGFKGASGAHMGGGHFEHLGGFAGGGFVPSGDWSLIDWSNGMHATIAEPGTGGEWVMKNKQLAATVQAGVQMAGGGGDSHVHIHAPAVISGREVEEIVRDTARKGAVAHERRSYGERAGKR